MPLELPKLDDRNFEQLLLEAKQRITITTPEWTNFDVESDPGITIIELFAFLTDSLLYRADRIPQRNRLKFLQLLGVPLQPASAANGIIVIRNERGPVQPLRLDRGVVVTAGNVKFLTRDPVNVLPVEAQVYYKRKIARTDPRYEDFNTRYEAVRMAALAAAGETEAGGTTSGAGGGTTGAVELAFYETMPLPPPTPGNPSPVVNLSNEETMDNSLYLALLAPKNVDPEDVREAIANQTLSIGVVPALNDDVPSLKPLRRGPARSPVPNLYYEIADPASVVASYKRLMLVQQPDVLGDVGVVQVALPGKSELAKWNYTEPMQEGTGDFPPRIEDQEVSKRLVTWLRLRLPKPATSGATTGGTTTGSATTSGAGGGVQPTVSTQSGQTGTLNARLSWVGVNAARVTQAIPVVNELLGTVQGIPNRNVAETDQTYKLANTPVIPSSMQLEVEDINFIWRHWQLTDDLLAAGENEEVFTLDPESGVIRFGDGLRGARPQPGRKMRASYEYGGGPQGNVAIGAIKVSTDTRLQGGYKIENPIATWGGDAGETVADGERNIPLYLRHRDHLVTAQDFADITRRTPGVDVGRVEVLPLFQPDRPLDSASGVVTVMVVPAFDSVRPLWPMPNRLFLRQVCDYLDPRRLVTTEIFVRGPVYVPVYLSVGIEVRGGYFRDRVIQAVTERLNEYLSSLEPGGPDGLGWPINKRLMKKDLEAVITRVAGVEFVVSMELGVRTAFNVEEAGLSGLELPMILALSVREGDAEPLAAVIGAPVEQPPNTRIVPVPVSKSKC